MNLYCPVKKTVWGQVNNLDDLKNHIAKSGQPFGVDWSGPASEFNPAYPSNVSLYQYLNFNPPTNTHSGVDIPVTTGTEIFSSTNGIIKEVSESLTKGLGVVVYDPLQRCKTLYWHLRDFPVKVGDHVKAGDLIGYSDNTGYSKGPHLHWELKLTDEQGNSLNSVDPMPYLVWHSPMTENEVKALQVLEGYQDPDGLQFWVGKPLSEYLKARLADKVRQESEVLQKL